ncbi:putative DNA modification/repair radical SAM protein [Marvinbryantia formatexigens DSM 14469]|uniref:DNA modification/repair radical SAM protein n=1 Tax=Marvinbryantia formatexigens DSM 14469 TaxID=478749 RepID=C6LH26_9FIRM|nr:putative DNA modification/repair radical SAM protein [Marvinbryantia formatexigens]EET60084.1 putative DNA modification/repair radical SAM protein [Marvinbryantia formatexigens DSM 14469]UWO23874.1 putative DNA modification/repair radical SAM protein [Marvinbryantia formatexigens DSM 14469]SDG51405.1 putative DNA modification/repair radical SAM protein [Marvinbryantia formatexigens]
MEIVSDISLKEKLHILADAAKYDVACTSSGVDRKGKEGFLGNSVSCGICHSFASDGRCISLLKILLTNHCVYDCKYCINRVSNDVVRTAFTPQEVCQLTTEFYKRNYIEGLFLSSGIWKNPTYTMEQICQTLYLLRTEYKFNGYIHVKAIPGAPEELLAAAGYLADRMSVNLELPTGEGLKKLAPNKSHRAILKPMRMMTDTIAGHRLAIGKSAQMERSGGNRYLSNSIFRTAQLEQQASDAERGNSGGASSATGAGMSDGAASATGAGTSGGSATVMGAGTSVQRDDARQIVMPEKPGASGDFALPGRLRKMDWKRPFAPAGQSTQMIIGATPETDYHLLKTTQHLYQTYDLKRVFFSAYVPLNEDSALPAPGTPAPLLREHRLYQADWLLRFYGFQADELLTIERPNFNEQLDPKCDWALRHLELFPVEINRAPYDMILRVPGVGPKSAMRIVQARRHGALDFQHLKRIGVVLKRAHYFITCSGKMMYRTPIEEQYITRQLVGANQKENWQIMHQNEQSFRQMSLFDDFQMQV